VFALRCSRTRKRCFHQATLAIVLLVPAAGGHAWSSSRPIREEARIAVGQFRRVHPQAIVELNPVTGLARSLVNDGEARSPLAESPVDAAAAFVAEHRKMLLGDRSPAELQLHDVQQLATSSHVRYQQLYRGLPVWGARLSVHTNVGGYRMVHSSVRPRLQLDPSPVLKPADAVRAALGAPAAALCAPAARSMPPAAALLSEREQSEHRARAQRPPSGSAATPERERSEHRARAERASSGSAATTTLGVLPLPDGARLVYRVDAVDFRFFVDARSGAILKKLDRRKSTQDEGSVVDENLLTTPQLVTRAFPYLNHTGQSGYLSGAFANIWTFDRVDWSGDYFVWGKRLSQESDYHFTAQPTDGRFDEQMAYYHVNRAHDYFRGAFGFTGRDDMMAIFVHVPEIDWKNKKVRGALDNAYYHPYFDALFFGDGTGVARGGINPTSRDSDVIYHEYTHAVMGRIVPDLSWEKNDYGGALQEAYADYFACTLNNDPDMGEYSMGNLRGMRTMQHRFRYPDDVDDPHIGEPEEHWTGKIWGGACWDLRQKLGPAVADQVIFHSMYYLPEDGTATFEKAAQAVAAADEERYAGAHKAVIREVMAARGIPVLES
jgi:Zn-dependent metalloprotease